MKAKQMFIISSILCLVFMGAQEKPVNSDDLISMYDGEMGQTYYGDHCQINIVPALPMVDDAIQVISSGVWSTGCVPQYQAHQVVGNVIGIDFVYDPSAICPLVITPWQHAVDVGILPSGIYEVYVYINGACCGTKSFVVFEELRQSYLPLVAKYSDG